MNTHPRRSLHQLMQDIYHALTGETRVVISSLKADIENLELGVRQAHHRILTDKSSYEQKLKQAQSTISHTMKELAASNAERELLNKEKQSNSWIMSQKWAAVRRRREDGTYEWTMSITLPYASEDFTDCVYMAATQSQQNITIQ